MISSWCLPCTLYHSQIDLYLKVTFILLRLPTRARQYQEGSFFQVPYGNGALLIIILGQILGVGPVRLEASITGRCPVWALSEAFLGLEFAEGTPVKWKPPQQHVVPLAADFAKFDFDGLINMKRPSRNRDQPDA
jgi:hypothetical protein